MKRVAGLSLIIAAIGFVVWSDDPLNELFNFIIAGSVPGTNISIGFWATLLLVVSLFWLILRSFKNQRQQMIERHTAQNKTEKIKKEFEDSNKIEFDKSKRSVIAARSTH